MHSGKSSIVCKSLQSATTFLLPDLMPLPAPAYTPSQQAKGQFSQLWASRTLAHEYIAFGSTQ
jgi:hypothetical protein